MEKLKLLSAAAALLFGSCSLLQQADIEKFIDTGMTNVLLRSATFRTESGKLSRAVSVRTVTCDLEMINPKSFDVVYTLEWEIGAASFTVQPPSSPVPTDPQSLSFDFVLDPSEAEHKTIAFRLGKYVPSLNKTYGKDTFSILCDSPPNPAFRVATIMDSNQESTLAVALPRQPSDDDLSALRITWCIEGAADPKTETYDIADLAVPPQDNPFSYDYDCYFRAPECAAGYGYSYEVVVIDEAGQESEAAATTSTANVFYVNYYGNGNTGGSAPASVGYRYAAAAAVAGIGDLTKTNYAFSRWNTRADGTGTSYSPGATIAVPAGDVDLYAQWSGNSTGIGIDFPTAYQALSFADSDPSIAQGDAVTFQTNNATLAAVASGWTWYVDGVEQAENSPQLILDAATTGGMLGSYLIAARVVYAGVAYSGNLTLTVHR